EIGTVPGTPLVTLGGTACRHHTVGQRVVFGRSDTGNGGLPALESTFSFSLDDSGTLFVGVNGSVLDQATWAGATQGASRSVDPSAEDPTGNENLAKWCDATTHYGAGADTGTPGAENDVCPVANTCLDAGTPRAIVSPVVGDLIITEYL